MNWIIGPCLYFAVDPPGCNVLHCTSNLGYELCRVMPLMFIHDVVMSFYQTIAL